MNEQLQLYPLTPEEVLERGHQLAGLVAEYDRLEDEMEDAHTAYTDALKKLRKRMAQLAQVVSHEQEWRDVYAQALRRGAADEP